MAYCVMCGDVYTQRHDNHTHCSRECAKMDKVWRVQYKICTKCHIKKRVTEFHREKHGLYGRRGQCKDCKRVYNKAHKKTYCTTPAHKESQRRWYKKNRDYALIKQRMYDLGHPQYKLNNANNNNKIKREIRDLSGLCESRHPKCSNRCQQDYFEEKLKPRAWHKKHWCKTCNVILNDHKCECCGSWCGTLFNLSARYHRLWAEAEKYQDYTPMPSAPPTESIPIPIDQNYTPQIKYGMKKKGVMQYMLKMGFVP